MGWDNFTCLSLENGRLNRLFVASGHVNNVINKLLFPGRVVIYMKKR